MIGYKQADELLNYDPDTGELTWRVSRQGARAGDTAGAKDPRGYIRVMVLGRAYMAHRLAWLLYYGYWPDEELDHINHREDDNRIENLREVNRINNTRNRSLSKNNTSGVCGVSWDERTGKWYAQVCVGHKSKYLGRFDDLDEAVAARQAANEKYNFHTNHGKEVV